MSELDTQAISVQQRMAHRLVQRRRAERRFKFYCQAMISLAVACVFLVLGLIVAKSSTAFSRHYLDISLNNVEIDITAGSDTVATAERINKVIIDIDSALGEVLGVQDTSDIDTKIVHELFSRLAVISAIKSSAQTIDTRTLKRHLRLPIGHELDLYLKNRHIDRKSDQIRLDVTLMPAEGRSYFLLLPEAGPTPDAFAAAANPGTETLLQIGGSWFELAGHGADRLEIRHLIGPQPTQNSVWPDLTRLTIAVASHDRKLSNRQLALAEKLVAQGNVTRRFNRELFVNADSTLPEIAGVAGAVIGTILTLLVTSLIALPIGVLAAIYLEELAPSNRLTNLLEININNLAAIPSIIFGLLGAAVFLNTLGMPRSIPLVGGLVLGLLVLPTVIISSRAALAAVPYDLRAGALALGASRMRTVFDHVLPVAGPGVMTGAILAMARAIGETAPLLLIGMVAFIHEIPRHVDDETTVLPVLVYKWFSSAERAWDPMTAAVVIILLGLLICLNLIAVVIRWQMDKTWARL